MFSMMKMANSKLFHNKKAAFGCVQTFNTWYMAITPLEQDNVWKVTFVLLTPSTIFLPFLYSWRTHTRKLTRPLQFFCAESGTKLGGAWNETSVLCKMQVMKFLEYVVCITGWLCCFKHSKTVT